MTNRTSEALLRGLEEIGINPFGPPQVTETDQEGGLITEGAKTWLSQMGTELKKKGVGSHADMVE
eukprot:11617251-Prorocentrum_lima.AAC.1